MKKILFIAVVAIGAMTSCDHVENPYPATVSQGTWDLYPNGDSTHYYTNVFTGFSANTNADRNVVIEDYTGHYCVFCPAAAAAAEATEAANPGRVFVSTVHAGPFGTGTLQQLYPSSGYTHEFYNSTTEAIGNYFGNDWAGSLFQGNPFGSVSRYDAGNGTPTMGPATWDATATSLLTTNDLKVNIQAESNYYPSTRGFFLHVEAENISAGNELKLVTQLHEDTMVAFQLFPGSVTDSFYVHHDILRGTLDGKTFGESLDASHLDANGKYYFDYIYELPAGYDPDNMHVLIYVRDAVTEEIYHVIEEHVH